MQDEIAGYYISDKELIPSGQVVINDIFEELFNRKVELRILPNLWDLAEEIKKSTLNWSLCRMGNAENKL